MNLRFNSSMRVGGRFDTGFTQDQVKNEPMLFNCSLPSAYEQGGPITRAFIDQYLAENEDISEWVYNKEFVFDSRVHMLMKGWFPCIPGYHHDDVPRGKDGQPDYLTPAYRSQHVMGLVNGDICPTQFAVGECELALPPEGEIIYKHWHREVEELIVRGDLVEQDAPSGVLVYFDDNAFHQGQRALDGGWRWFGRLSWRTDRADHVTNEIRRQVQVYLEYPMEGW